MATNDDSERSQLQRPTPRMILFRWNVQNKQIDSDRKRSGSRPGLRGG